MKAFAPAGCKEEAESVRIPLIDRSRAKKLASELLVKSEPKSKVNSMKNVMVSTTALESGHNYGFPRVTGLTKQERAHLRTGGVVVFKSDYPAGTSKTYWRLCSADAWAVRPKPAATSLATYGEKTLKQRAAKPEVG